MDTKTGRREAFWLALCRCVIINPSGVLHSTIVEEVVATEDMAEPVNVFRKKDLIEDKFDPTGIKNFALDLGVFTSDAHTTIRTALKIGEKAPFPVDRTMESLADKAKAMEMMTLPFRLPAIADAIGINKAPP